MHDIDIDIILFILNKFNSNSLRIDNINSMYQGNELSRLFMFDVHTKNDGLKACNDIYEYLNFQIKRNKVNIYILIYSFFFEGFLLF